MTNFSKSDLIQKVKFDKIINFKNKSKRNASEGKESGAYKFFTSSMTQNKFIDETDYTTEAIIIGTGGNPSIHYSNEPFSTSADCFVVDAKNNSLNIKYLYYYLFYNLDVLGRGFKGIGLKHISKSYLQNLEIILPKRETQDKIVRVFDSLNEILNRIEQRKNLYDLFLKSIYYSLFGNPNTNNFNFPTLPIGKLAESVNMGGTPSTKNQAYYKNGNISWMRSGDIVGDYIYDIPYKITKAGLDNSNAKMYKEGDVVIALNGQGKTRGTTAILAVSTSSNQSVASISPNKEVTSEYLHYNLKLRYKEIRDLTGDNQRSGLNLKILKEFNVPIPPLDKQMKFSDIVKAVYKIEKNQEISKEFLTKFANLIFKKCQKLEL